jgi:hypothetical protein
VTRVVKRTSGRRMKMGGRTTSGIGEAMQPFSVAAVETGELEEVVEVKGDMLIQRHREESQPEGGEIPAVAAGEDGEVLAVVVVVVVVVDGEELAAAAADGGLIPEAGITLLL